MDGLKNWFGGLQPRERTLVSIGALVVAVTVLYLLINPLYKATEKAQSRIADKTLDLETIQNASKEVRALGVTSTSSSGQPLVVVVDRSSSNARLAPFLKRNQPDGDNSIRVTFEGAPFNSIIDFLIDLQSQHGLALGSATLNKGQAEGTVNASLTLVRTSS